MLCHISAFAGYFFPFGNIVGPLVIWLFKRDESVLIDEHGRESLNFQISITIYALGAFLLTFFLIGFPLLIGVAIFQFIAVIIAGVKAGGGESFRYPLALRFVR